MKTLEIPFISGLESLSFEELDKRMETGASKDFICEVNWQEYPYKPSAAVRVARSESHLVIFYDVKGLDPQGPLYKSVIFSEGKATVEFEVGSLGLSPINSNLEGFEIAGSDKVFHPAKARIHKNGRSVVVQSDKVSTPVAVRYGIGPYFSASLFNNSGIPACPFTTE